MSEKWHARLDDAGAEPDKAFGLDPSAEPPVGWHALDDVGDPKQSIRMWVETDWDSHPARVTYRIGPFLRSPFSQEVVDAWTARRLVSLQFRAVDLDQGPRDALLHVPRAKVQLQTAIKRYGASWDWVEWTPVASEAGITHFMFTPAREPVMEVVR